MKPEPPNPTATMADIARYLQDLHECNEQQHAETTARLVEATIDRKNVAEGLVFDRRINASALITIVVLIIGMFVAGIRWTSNVDSRLADLNVSAAHRDVRLDSIDVNIQNLQEIAIANHETLVGADRAARGR